MNLVCTVGYPLTGLFVLDGCQPMIALVLASLTIFAYQYLGVSCMRLRMKRSNSFITIASHTNRIGPNSTSKSHTVSISNHSAFLAGGLLLPIAVSGVATPGAVDNASGNLSQVPR